MTQELTLPRLEVRVAFMLEIDDDFTGRVFLPSIRWMIIALTEDTPLAALKEGGVPCIPAIDGQGLDVGNLQNVELYLMGEARHIRDMLGIPPCPEFYLTVTGLIASAVQSAREEFASLPWTERQMNTLIPEGVED